MKTISKLFATLACAAVAVLPAQGMTWTLSGNVATDDTGSWSITTGWNNTYNGYEASNSSYTENGANGILDLTTFEADTGRKLVSIGNNRWQNNSYITEVYFPDTVVYLGREIFKANTALVKVKMSNTVSNYYGGQHFLNCSALKTMWYTGVEEEEGVIKIPPSFTKLPDFFMSGCTSIEHVEAPGVIRTYDRCFHTTTSLKSVSLSPNLVELRSNGGNWKQTLFHNDDTLRDTLVDFQPSTMCADFATTDSSSSQNLCNGMLANTGITNYFDFSACSFDTIPSLAFYKSSIAGATIPASVTTVKDQAFKYLPKSASFLFLGDVPTFSGTGDNATFRNYNNSYNTIGYRHVLYVDAETYPAWTNAANCVLLENFSTNSTVSGKFSTSDSDYPGADTLGVTGVGHRGNEYAWLVQYHATYPVTFVDEDGTTVLLETEAANGGYATYTGEAPTKDSTDQYDYTFAGWSPDPASTVIDAATTFTATYTSSIRSYTITWQWDNGTDTTTETETLEYGAAPSHADVTKASDETYSYSFSGWSTDGETVLSEIPTVTGAATYIAVFEQHEASTTATVSWFDEDGETALNPATTTVTKGEQPTHDEPSKASSVDTVYTFDGWVEIGGDGTVVATADLPAVTADISYKAHYATATRQYTIAFVDWDGSDIASVSLNYGSTAEAVAAAKPTDPTRDADAEYTYTFSEWTPAFAEVTGDTTYTAVYTATANTYNATFVDGVDGTTLEGPTTYAYGAAITAPATPEHYGYTFSAWSPDASTMPAADTTFTALYTTNSYTITWVNGNSTTTASYPYLMAAGDITVPTGKKSSTSKASYTFLAWTPELEAVQSNTTYTATFQGTILDPMVLLYNGATVDTGAGSGTVSATLSNYTTTEDGFSGGIGSTLLNFSKVVGSAAGTVGFEAPAVTAAYSALEMGKGYEWTLAATQTIASANMDDVAVLHGRFWAKPARTWFTAEQAVFSDGAFAPGIASSRGQQLRLHATMTLPTLLPRALPDASGAVVAIAPYRKNAGHAPHFHVWNGAEWVELYGAYATEGATVELLGVIDFAAGSGDMIWYADGVELTDEDGNWFIPLSTSARALTRFTFASDTVSLDSFAGDYDLGFNGSLIILR